MKVKRITVNWLKPLKHCAIKRINILLFLIDIICFEYILLEFKELIDWVYAPQDELLKKRASAAAVRKKLVESIQNGNFQYKEIQEIMEYDSGIEEHNIEQLVAKLLFDLTRNTGFEVSKETLGECWTKSC